ncbi:MAG: NFACT family protein [Lachnospiraceae bacterium]|nr:NFACT family protein [Lachnospiraceae bacterium]
MAFDGIVISNIVRDMKEKLVGGRILKIQQPEKDELIITIKNYDQYRLFISADASLPLIYLSSSKKEAPITAPNFCMLLRKYIGTARVVDVYQPGFERVVVMELEHLDEMGDVCRKKLITEIMGKHSNIIFCEEAEAGKLKIIDSIKHVSSAMSSVREVLPGREYFIPKQGDKIDPSSTCEEEFVRHIGGYPDSLSKAVYMTYTGFSPLMSNELIIRAGFDGETNTRELSEDMLIHLYRRFDEMMQEIKDGNFSPCICYKTENEETDAESIKKEGTPVEFSSLELTSFENAPGMHVISYESISNVLEEYYAKKNVITNIRQKSADLRKVVANAVERTVKKLELQKKQLKDTEKRDKYKLYGELLTTYGYGLENGMTECVLNNYYTGEDIKVPLDKDISPLENAKKYYEKYAKLKRTFEAVSVQVKASEEELEHLESVNVALGIATLADDLETIKNELIECGYIKGHFGKGTGLGKGKPGKAPKKNAGSREKSKPLHYVTEDGFHLYVGKNNYQNDELTFKMANGGDWWFHAKKNAGSHVIVKTEGKELPDRVYEQAASLAAYYSKAAAGSKIDVDYLQRKDVKKPNGAKPGFVVYYTNYSMTVAPKTDGLTLVE